MQLKVLPGKPSPLGANWDGLGVNFAIAGGDIFAMADRSLVLLCQRTREADGED